MDPKYMCDKKVKQFSAYGPNDLAAIINKFAEKHYIHQVSYAIDPDLKRTLRYQAMVLYEEYDISLHINFVE